jgi:diguanylate cyclase (GGDEF)-like protein
MYPLRGDDDLFNKYKRQTYRLAFPLGLLITILYVFTTSESNNIRFTLGLTMVFTMAVLSFSVWSKNRSLNVIEWVFYFFIVSYFLVLTQLSISEMIDGGTLSVEPLSDHLYSLTIWLIVFMVAGFLTLKSNHSSKLILYVIVSVLVMGFTNVSYLVRSDLLTPGYVFRWVNSLGSLLVVILLIQRMGFLQQKNASTDPLTGLLNRRATYQVLSREMERSHRYKKVFSIILLDVDHFKIINDTLGHAKGDEVLIGLSRLMEKALRQADSIGRWGGEEFLLVLPETDGRSAGMTAERICRLIRESKPGGVEHVTASFGVSSYQVEWSLEELIHRADQAMYQSKQSGRNQVSVLV